MIKTGDKGQLLSLITAVMTHNKNLYADIVSYFEMFDTFWNLVLYKFSSIPRNPDKSCKCDCVSSKTLQKKRPIYLPGAVWQERRDAEELRKP